MSARIVVLGGGVGGTLTANLLQRRLPEDAAAVTLVDPTGVHLYQPGFLYVALGKANSGFLLRSLRSLLDEGVELVVDRAVGVDLGAGQVLLERGGPLPYDHLVVATGSELDKAAVPGFDQGATTFYTMADAERLREQLRRFRGGDVVVGVAGLPYKCPPAPVEFALLLEEALRRRGLRDRTRMRFLAPAGGLFGVEPVARLVREQLQLRGIDLHEPAQVTSVDPRRHELTTADGTVHGYDLAVLVPPHKPADVVVAAGLVDHSGWVPVDRETLRVAGQDRVYALGDTTALPLSKSGSTAHFESPVVVEQIRAAVTGTPPRPSRARYGGRVVCFLETGDRKATLLSFDYTRPPRPPRPSPLWHAAKWAFNRIYWWTVPRGLLA